MAKYLVPFKGLLLVEANSWQQAEIMSIEWSQSLIRLKTGQNIVRNTINLSSSKNGCIEVESAEVQATDIAFASPPFIDITTKIEAHREGAIEKERQYSQKKGLPETDLTDEQIILFALKKDTGGN